MLRLCTNLKSKLTVPMVCGTASYDAHTRSTPATRLAEGAERAREEEQAAMVGLQN